jgi:integrase
MAARNRSLKYNDWPRADQQVWQAIIASGDLLDDNGPGAGWAPTTKNNVRKCYGYWLHWLLNNHGPCDGNAPPMHGVTPERVRDYIKDLEQTCASSTTFAYILDLLRFAQAASPKRDWDWLVDIKNRLWARTTPAKDKTVKIRPAADLFQLGLDLMDGADHVKCRYNPQASETQFRDGLMIALLAARPVRLKNFCSIEIGRHLTKVDGTYWLRFEASEVKNRKHIEVPIPGLLTPHTNKYREVYRPVLLGSSRSNRLWISKIGKSLSQSTTRYHIKNRTLNAFGVAITPHLFRDCAATSVAIEDPDHVRIAMNILGHHSLSTTQKYYDQSQMLAAGRTYQSALATLRYTMRKDSRGPYKPQHPNSTGAP